MSDEAHTKEGLDETPVASEQMADFAVMSVGSVIVDLPDTFATLSLQEHEPPFRAFQLPVGLADGAAIAAITEERPSPRPSTQDLFATALMRTGIDVIAARITAMGFAIVGNFEGAVYAWRYLTPKWSNSVSAVILAAGSGALGVRLGEPLSEPDSNAALLMAEAGEPLIYEVGLEPNERSMRSAIGLVWRLIIVWMALLLMLTSALWLG